MEKVIYSFYGETVAGEQAPFQYSTCLADKGYTTLIFDLHTVGKSTGQPRQLENLKIKNEDIVAGLDYLQLRGDINKSKLFLVGILIGVASVTGYFYDHETDVYMVCAGCVNTEPGTDISSLKMPTPEQAHEAKLFYEKTGEIIYQPLVDPKVADPDTGSLAGLPGPVVWAWYGPWTLKRFDNRYAPVLIIHRDTCMNVAAAKRHFESIPMQKKKLIWDNDVLHFQHYN
ncbi:hypothetical protein BDV23DRAFT_174088 [Aspergillus alliaceus]|uniref:AB hydrolase-1 domain-containing protein n=1 Tax=Petromyces alliaceus TaxID=209559 RepID=A0A5N7C227_PETAA|nr:hypothetical protein BDV23DRAFT_174088 [Aspergillus alliaceus]